MGVRLPAEYQEVEYIRSTSNRNEYLDLGIKYITSMNIEMVFAGSYSGGGARGHFFGAIDSDFRIDISSSNYASSTWLVHRGDNSDLSETKIGGYGNNDPTRVKIVINNQIVEIYKSTDAGSTWIKAATNSTEMSDFTVENSLYLFWCNSPSGDLRRWNGKCYSFSIKNVIDLVPCYRKSDSKPGMYDLVSGKFFTNQGTGEFVVGPDVIDSISPWLVARRRMLMQQEPELYPIGTDIVSVYASNWKDNYSYMNNGGNSYTSGMSLCKDYFPINPKYTYRKNGYRLYNYCCWYNANKQFISSFSLNTTTAGNITNIPANACFMRISTQTNSKTSLKIIRTA